MDKREFLKASGAMLTSTVLHRMAPAEPKAEPRTNWSGNYTYNADDLRSVHSIQETQQVLARASQAKALGSRHSFNSIADTTGEQVSTREMGAMVLDEASHTVTVDSGIAYGHLAPYLESKGYALHNLASLPHISVAGACSTATHGSGWSNGNLSTAVTALELVTAEGKVVTLSRATDGDAFRGAVVSLGALGVITRVTLQVQPTFQVRQAVYENLAFSELEHNFEPIFRSGYSVSLFTDWQKHRGTQLWVKQRMDPNSKAADLPRMFYGATMQTADLHPLAGHSAENCTEQMGIPGPWYERLPHFRMNFTPSSGQELQTEYFVPREQGYAAIRAVEALRDMITPHLFITEFRTIAADDLWLSPAYKRDSLALHFTWKPEWNEVKKVLPHIEEKLAPFDARPHWAKLFTVPPARLKAVHPRMGDFIAMAQRYDSKGTFRNQFLNTNVFGA